MDSLSQFVYEYFGPWGMWAPSVAVGAGLIIPCILLLFGPFRRLNIYLGRWPSLMLLISILASASALVLMYLKTDPVGINAGISLIAAAIMYYKNTESFRDLWLSTRTAEKAERFKHINGETVKSERSAESFVSSFIRNSSALKRWSDFNCLLRILLPRLRTYPVPVLASALSEIRDQSLGDDITVSVRCCLVANRLLPDGNSFWDTLEPVISQRQNTRVLMEFFASQKTQMAKRKQAGDNPSAKYPYLDSMLEAKNFRKAYDYLGARPRQFLDLVQFHSREKDPEVLENLRTWFRAEVLKPEIAKRLPSQVSITSVTDKLRLRDYSSVFKRVRGDKEIFTLAVAYLWNAEDDRYRKAKNWLTKELSIRKDIDSKIKSLHKHLLNLSEFARDGISAGSPESAVSKARRKLDTSKSLIRQMIPFFKSENPDKSFWESYTTRLNSLNHSYLGVQEVQQLYCSVLHVNIDNPDEGKWSEFEHRLRGVEAQYRQQKLTHFPPTKTFQHKTPKIGAICCAECGSTDMRLIPSREAHWCYRCQKQVRFTIYFPPEEVTFRSRFDADRDDYVVDL